MPFTRATSYAGLFALLLGIVVVTLISSLVAADRALARAEQRGVMLDARATAALAERELQVQATQLADRFGPLLEPPTRDTLGIPNGFEDVWIADTLGRVRAHAPPTSPTPSGVAALVLATRDSALRVLPLEMHGDTADGALLLAVSLYHRGRRLGVAVGRLSGPAFLRTLTAASSGRHSAALRTHGQTIATMAEGLRGPNLAAAAPVRLSRDTFDLVIAHPREGQAQRSALWVVGIIAFVALVIGLARERRHALRLAARTGELERLYQEVARSNRMKSEFLANISHELRTPLNAIVGFVEMLREGVYGELTPRQALPVDRIAASATHLRLLVDRLLDIAKIAAGRVDLHVESLVLRPFVLNVASEMESLVAERGLSLAISIASSVPRVRTDQTHLRQILINLIGNAVKYTATGGIQIRARVTGNGAVAEESPSAPLPAPPDAHRRWVALQVSDTGIGIPVDDLERIFDEFEQVNAGPRTDSARRGTGLGLAISRRLARLLGGDITVASELGVGSTFTVWLPADGDARTDPG
jgi:signal transduction histidine kinase